MKDGAVPVVDGGVGLPLLVAAMRAQDTPAVLVRRGTGHVLLTAVAIFGAMNEAIEADKNPADVTAADVTGGETAASLPAGTAVPVIGWDTPLVSGLGALAGALDAALRQGAGHGERRFAVLIDDPERARLATPSDSLAAMVAGPFTQCVCAGPSPRVHSYTPAMLKGSLVCQYPHAAPVTCS